MWKIESKKTKLEAGKPVNFYGSAGNRLWYEQMVVTEKVNRSDPIQKIFVDGLNVGWKRKEARIMLSCGHEKLVNIGPFH